MPMFTYKCGKCDTIIEKFTHNLDESVEIVCEKCGSICERQFSLYKSLTQLDAKSTYNDKILPEVKKTLNDISKGKEETFIDIYGEK